MVIRLLLKIDLAIKLVVSEAIVSEDVVDIFDAADIKKTNISILDQQFLDEIQKMEHKKVSSRITKKLLRYEINKRSSYNLVECKKFSDKLEVAIKRYHNGQIDSVEFFGKMAHTSRSR